MRQCAVTCPVYPLHLTQLRLVKNLSIPLPFYYVNTYQIFCHVQALIEKLAEFEPGLVERVVASLPLTSLDPHRASVFTRGKRLWRGVGAIAAALGTNLHNI